MPTSLELKNRKLEIKFCAVFLFISLVLCYIGWASYREVKEYQSAEDKVLAINEQLRALNRFMVAMVDTETGQRGYLLTNRETYLKPYYNGLNQVNTALRQVHTHLAKDHTIAPTLEEINLLKADKLAELTQTIALHKTGDVDGAKQLVLEGAGERIMDQIREQVDRLLFSKRTEAEDIKRFITIQAERADRSLKLFIALIILCMVLGYVTIFRGTTARRRLRQALAFAHNYDPLTELVNRTYFSQVTADYLKHALRDKTMAAILMVDLDNFSSINTRYGYAAGDCLLKDIGNRLKKMGRKGDVIARLDGDEFAMLVSPVGNLYNCAYWLTGSYRRLTPH
jgi:CHASE3 domain sensor protein